MKSKSVAYAITRAKYKLIRDCSKSNGHLEFLKDSHMDVNFIKSGGSLSELLARIGSLILIGGSMNF